MQILALVASFVASAVLSFSVAPALTLGNGTGTLNQLSQWTSSADTVRLASSTASLRIPALINCDTIDTDASGIFSCGTDATGGGSGSGTISTSSPLSAPGVVYATSPSTVASAATTSVSCSGSASCTGFTVIGPSPITITATDSTASTTLLSDRNTWSNLNTFSNATTTLLSGTTAWFTTFVGALIGNASTVTNGIYTTDSGTVTNTMLANPSTTVNSQTCTLGSSCTVTAASSTLLSNNNTWSGLNTFSNSSTSLATFTTAPWLTSLTANTLLSLNANKQIVSTTTLTTVNGTVLTLGTTATITAASSTLLSNNNTWTGLNAFSAASSTRLSVFDRAYFGGSATSTFDSAGNLVIPSGSSFTNTGRSDGCATWVSAVLTSSGVACGSGTVTSVSGANGISGTVTTSGSLLLVSYLSTSSAETSGQIPFWTTTNGNPAQLSGGAAGLTWTSTGSKLTATNASTTALSASTVFYSPVTSAVLLADANNKVGAATTQTCTNQFVRAMSAAYSATCATVGAADVSLANLTATNSTLTFSGTYNGSTARTIGINLGNANTWTALQTINNASTTALTVGTFLGLPTSASCTPSALGGACWDTTKNQLQVATSTAFSAVLPTRQTPSFTYSTSTTATGTTTRQFAQIYDATTMLGYGCKTNAGSWNVQIGNGTASSSMMVASTTNNFNVKPLHLSVGDTLYVSIGTPASSPSQINCTTVNTIDPS